MFPDVGLAFCLIPFETDIFHKLHYNYNVCTMQIHITFELSGPKGRSLFGSGGGAQRRNELERFVMWKPTHVCTIFKIGHVLFFQKPRLPMAC